MEMLLPFLDSGSTKRLAESHPLTLQVLVKPIVWGKLIKRTYPKDEKIDSVSKARETPLAPEKTKARSLAGILSLAKDPAQLHKMEGNLLQAICRRFPPIDDPHSNRVCLRCSCFHVYYVSSWGFLVLEEVGAMLSSAKLSVLIVDSHGLKEPFLSALGSRALNQQEKIQLNYDYVELISGKSMGYTSQILQLT